VRNDYQQHPLAAQFPSFPENGITYSAFKNIVRSHGPGAIVLYEGKILWGWNDFRACRDLGIEPEFSVFDGDGVLGAVLREYLFPRLSWGQITLFVAENTPWSTRGGDRKSKGFSRRRSSAEMMLGLLNPYAKNGEDLSEFVSVSFESVRKLHYAMTRWLKDNNGKDIPDTLALLPEVIEALREGKIDTSKKVCWLATQTHDFQRDYLNNIRYKGVKVERGKRQKFGAKTGAAKIIEVFDAQVDEEKAKFMIKFGIPWWNKHKHEHGG
jgi:hypothetical protein